MYDGLYTLTLRLLNIACAAALGILTARLLGPAGKGIYTLPMVQAGLVIAAYAGLGSTTSYFMLHRKPGLGTLRTAFTAGAVFIAAGAIVVALVAVLGNQRWAALPAILSLPSAAIVNIATGYAVGIKRVRYSTTVAALTTALTLAIMAIGFLTIGRTAGIAIAAWLLANAAIAIAALIVMIAHARRFHDSDAVGLAEFMRFSLKISATSLVSMLNYRADLYVVAIMTSPAALGMYSVAVSAAEMLLVPTQVAALVTAPHIASLDRSGAAHLAARTTRLNLMIALAVCGLLFLVAPGVITLLYGAAFTPVVGALRVLLVGVVAMSIGSSLSNYFTLRLGKPEISFVMAGSAATLCIVSSVLLVPHFGLIGAATASTVAYFIGQSLAVAYFSMTTTLPVRELLVPTMADLGLYLSAAHNIYEDSRKRLLHSEL